MKLNVIPSIIALLFSGLIAYGIYSWCQYAEMKLALAIINGIVIALTLSTCLGISLPNTRASVNVKVISGICAMIFAIISVVFCCLQTFTMPVYVITNGILLLIWLLSIYGIVKALK